MTTAELNIFVRIRAAQAQRQLMQMQAQLAALQRQTVSANAASNRPWFVDLSRSGSRLQWIGRQLSTNLTAPLAIAAGMAIKWGMDNESAMARVKKVYGDGARDASYYGKEIEALDRNFTALSEKFGQTKQSVIEIGAGWAAAGSSGAALARQTELTMRTMVIGEMEAAEATEALIAIQAQYGQNTEELTYTVQQLNAVENMSGTTLKGLVQGFSRAAGVARTAGVDTAHLAATIAALTPAAGTAKEAGTALKTIYSRMLGPTGEAADVMALMGINTAEAGWQSLNGAERMEKMAQSFESLTQPQKAVVGALIASRWQINKFDIAMREMTSSTGYYAKALDVLSDKEQVIKIAENELQTVLNTSGQKTKQAGVIIQNALVEAFQPMIPVFVQIMQWFAKLAKAFAAIDPGIRTTIIAVLLLLGVLGPLIIVMGLVALAVGQLAPMFIFLARVIMLPLMPFKLLWLAMAFTAAQARIISVAIVATTWAWAGVLVRVLKVTALAQRAWGFLMTGLTWAYIRAMNAAYVFLFVSTRPAQAAFHAWMISAQLAYHFASVAAQKVYTSSMLVLAQLGWLARTAWEVYAQTRILAIQRAWHTTMLAIQQVFYLAQRALQLAYTAASLAIQSAYQAASMVLTRAYLTAYGAYLIASHAVHLAYQTIYWHASLVAQVVGQAASTAANIAWSAIQLVIANGRMVNLIAIELIMWKARLLIQKQFQAMGLALSIAWNTARAIVTSSGWSKLIAMDLVFWKLRIIRQAASQSLSTTLMVAWNRLTLALQASTNGISLAILQMFWVAHNARQVVGQAASTALSKVWYVLSFANMNNFRFLMIAAEMAMWRGRLALQAVNQAISLAADKTFAVLRFVSHQAMTVKLAFVELVMWKLRLQIQKTYQAAILAVQRAFGAASLAISSGYHAASAALQRKFHAVSLALHHAFHMVWLATQRAFAPVTLAVQAAYQAVSTAIQRTWHTVSLALQHAWHMASLAITRAWAAAQVAISSAWRTVTVALHHGMYLALAAIQMAGQALMTGLTKVWARVTYMLWTALGALMTMNWKAVMGKLVAWTVAGMSGVRTAIVAGSKAIVGLLASPWILAIAAVIAILVIFKDEIKRAFQNIVAYFKNLPSGVAQGLSPLANIFVKIKDFIIKAWNKLPEGITNALIAVVRIVKAAAMKVYELFSYLNPFAHHSPSLVENVTEGMAVVGDQFDNASARAAANIDKIHNSIKSLQGAGAGMIFENEKAKDTEQRDKIVKAGGASALPAYDALKSDLKALEGDLKSANSAIEAQEAVMESIQKDIDAYDKQLKSMNKTLDGLKKAQDAASDAVDRSKEAYDRFANAQILGTRQAEDAIFSNEMAQKKLQLQIAKLNKEQEETANGADSITDAYAKLQGQIETMMGKQAELRAGGAGSDILGHYDEQIASLKAQQDALEASASAAAGGAVSGPSAAVSALQKQLDELQNQAEIMDLEKSLKFDPLTRQIEQFTNKTEEMPFGLIMGGLMSSEAAINVNTAAYDQATAAVEAQEAAIESVQTQRDALAETYDLEQEKLDGLKEAYDSIEESITAGKDALEAFTQAAEDTIQRQEELARKAKEATEGEGGANSPGVQNFLDAANGDFLETGGSQDGIGREGGIGDQSAEIDAITKGLTDELSNSLGGLNPFEPIKRWWNNTVQWFKDNVAPLGEPIMTMFRGIGTGIGDAFGEENSGKIGTFVQWVKNVWTTVQEVGTSIKNFAVEMWNLFGPNILETVNRLKEGIVDMYNKVQPALKELWNELGPAFQAIWSILKPVLGLTMVAIIGIIKVLWEMLNNVLKPVFSFIGTVLTSIVEAVTGAIKIVTGLINVVVGIVKMIIGVFTLDGDMIAEGWQTVVDGVGRVLGGIVDIVWAIIKSVGSLFWNAGSAIWGIVQGLVEGIVKFFTWLWDVLVGHSIIPDTINAIVDWWLGLPGKIMSFIWDMIVGIANFFGELPGKILDALGSLNDFLERKFIELAVYMVQNLPGWIRGVIDFFKSIPGRIVDAMGDIAELGVNLVKGFWQGLLDKGEWLKDKIIEWVKDKIPGPIKWALDIHSPSGVTEGFGENVAEGLAVGIDNKSSEVGAAVGRLSAQITSVTLPAVPMNDVLKDFADTEKDAASRLDILNNGLAKFRTENTGTEDVVQAVNDTMRETPAVLEGFTASMILANGQIDTTTEAGSRVYSQIKDVQAAFDGAGAAAYQYAIDHGLSAESAVQSAVDASTKIREQFVQQAIDSGLPIDAANRLADSYGLIPSDILTKLTADTDEARDAINSFIEANKDRELNLKIKLDGQRIQEAIDKYGAGSKEAWIASGIMLPTNATGGVISGPGNGTDDKILGLDQLSKTPTTWVSNGEFVVNAASTAKYMDILKQINAGTFQALAAGGPVSGDNGAAASDLAGALSTVASAVQAETDAVQAIWSTFVTEMMTSYGQYNTDTGAAFAGIATTVTAKHSEMFTAVAALTVTFKDGQVATFTGMNAALIALVVALAQQLQEKLNGMFTALDEVFKTGTESMSSSFQAMGDSMSATLTDTITPVFDAFQPMLDALEESFATTVDNVGKTWDGIEEKTAVPARFVINDVYNDGIRGAWNKFNTFLGLEALPEHVAKFAEGGKITGPGTGTSDSILARVANGEHVITAREVQGAGGHGAIEAARANWKKGLPAFAAGGPVDLNAAPWPGGGGESNLKPAAILARRNIHKYWPQIGTIGGYRAVDAYPDHPSGLALDIMTGDPIGTEVNNWLHANMAPLALNYTIWKQFYKPAGGGGNLMEDRGSATQNHMDHVHALFNANGVPGIQDGGVGGGGSSVDMVKMVTDGITDSMKSVRDRMPTIPGGIGQWPPKSLDKGEGMLKDFLIPLAEKMQATASAASGNISYQPSAGVEQWRQLAIDMLAKQGESPSLVNRLLMQMSTESSGNPNAINLTDINAQNGTPSKGLMQVIDPTFQTWRDTSLPNDIWDPAANIAASIRYTRGRYGSLEAGWNGVGYDNGGYLEEGIVGNFTGAKEPVLTSQQWAAMYALAGNSNTLTVEDIAQGFADGNEIVYGIDPNEKQTTAITAGLDEWQKSWTPAVYGALEDQTTAANATAAATEKQATMLDNFNETGGKIRDAVNGVSKVMLAVANAVSQQEQTFAAWAPVLEAIADLIGQIPDQTRDWQADNPVPGETEAERKAREAANAQTNIGKGLLQLFKDVAPVLLKSTAKIGVAIEQLITQNAPIVSAAIAMFPVNPVGAAIMLIPVILQSIFTIIPLIIDAIMEIVPALIKAILKFLTQFMPDSVYAYEDLAAAEAAVNTQLNGGAIAMGQGQRYPVVTETTVTAPTNPAPVMNFYGDMVLPNVTNGDDAQTLADNLLMIASNKS